MLNPNVNLAGKAILVTGAAPFASFALLAGFSAIEIPSFARIP